VAALKEEVRKLDKCRRRYLSRDEVASYIDSTSATVATMTSKRQIPHIKRGRRVLYDRHVIDAWLARQSIEPIVVD
jgi:excisionase family DNA binding protein